MERKIGQTMTKPTTWELEVSCKASDIKGILNHLDTIKTILTAHTQMNDTQGFKVTNNSNFYFNLKVK